MIGFTPKKTGNSGYNESGAMYCNCSISELLQKLKSNFSFHKQFSPQLEWEVKQTQVSILNPAKIESPKLQNYLSQRTIPVQLPSLHCKEIVLHFDGNNFAAIEFKNGDKDMNFESAFLTVSSSLKDVSFIGNGGRKITIAEGF